MVSPFSVATTVMFVFYYSNIYTSMYKYDRAHVIMTLWYFHRKKLKYSSINYGINWSQRHTIQVTEDEILGIIIM